MKITLSKDFLIWFRKTNYHLFENEEPISNKDYTTEVTEYVNDVLIEHMETLESDLDILQEGPDDSPDSGFLDEGGDLQ